MLSPMRDLGAHIKAVHAGDSNTAGAPTLITAAAGTDNVERTGPTIDCQDYHSGCLVIEAVAALASAKTLSFGVKIQESDDGSSWDTAVVLQAATVAATYPATTASVKIDVDLASRKRYARFLITADLSATGTDTALYAASFILGGARILPAE